MNHFHVYVDDFYEADRDKAGTHRKQRGKHEVRSTGFEHLEKWKEEEAER